MKVLKEATSVIDATNPLQASDTQYKVSADGHTFEFKIIETQVKNPNSRVGGVAYKIQLTEPIGYSMYDTLETAIYKEFVKGYPFFDIRKVSDDTVLIDIYND